MRVELVAIPIKTFLSFSKHAESYKHTHSVSFESEFKIFVLLEKNNLPSMCPSDCFIPQYRDQIEHLSNELLVQD